MTTGPVCSGWLGMTTDQEHALLVELVADSMKITKAELDNLIREDPRLRQAAIEVLTAALFYLQSQTP